VYGDPEGDPLGDASEAAAGDRYLALVERALRESYVLPATISERDRLHLRATVVLIIDAEGRIVRHTFESRSGNDAFDAALERAVSDARLPPPPEELRQKCRTEGMAVTYRP
jgi:colicin import membrane protein